MEDIITIIAIAASVLFIIFIFQTHRCVRVIRHQQDKQTRILFRLHKKMV